jgi:signal recognition particle subunit SRP54
MFDSLSSKLQNAFRNLRGLGKISESNVADSLREVRMALLEADVNFKVARDFIERVKAKSIGAEVVQSIQPGQQIIKIIHDELVELLGSQNATLKLDGNPSCILMVGLHGSGKTTSSGKLARLLQKQGRQPLLVAADVYRPAAMDQLETLGKQLGIPTFVKRAPHPVPLPAERGEGGPAWTGPGGGQDLVLQIAREALDFARANSRNVLIFDTAGRLQIDEPLVQELVRLRDFLVGSSRCDDRTAQRAVPTGLEILLVLDAATGQEAVNVATHFDQALHITGSILTKLDGDARGGAALSLKAVTGKPIKFAGVGEKLDEFEPFHPERMASRILGMGDVVSLVEKAAEAVDLEDAKRLEEKMRKGEFTLEDFLEQLRAMKKLGSLESVVGMLPGGAEMLKQQGDLSKQEKEFRRMEGMICGMTPKERENPAILNASRRRRIAAGSGVSVTELNTMLNKFGQMQQMMKKMGKFQKMLARMGGGLPGMLRR